MSYIIFYVGDSAELWVTLNAMGYDYNLVQDEAALFKVNWFIAYYLILHNFGCNIERTQIFIK